MDAISLECVNLRANRLHGISLRYRVIVCHPPIGTPSYGDPRARVGIVPSGPPVTLSPFFFHLTASPRGVERGLEFNVGGYLRLGDKGNKAEVSMASSTKNVGSALTHDRTDKRLNQQRTPENTSWTLRAHAGDTTGPHNAIRKPVPAGSRSVFATAQGRTYSI